MFHTQAGLVYINTGLVYINLSRPDLLVYSVEVSWEVSEKKQYWLFAEQSI